MAAKDIPDGDIFAFVDAGITSLFTIQDQMAWRGFPRKVTRAKLARW